MFSAYSGAFDRGEGPAGITPGADIIVNERQSGEMLHIPHELPKWTLDRKQLDRYVRPDVEQPLRFIARGVAGMERVELMPYYAIAHERYHLYWRLA